MKNYHLTRQSCWGLNIPPTHIRYVYESCVITEESFMIFHSLWATNRHAWLQPQTIILESSPPSVTTAAVGCGWLACRRCTSYEQGLEKKDKYSLWRCVSFNYYFSINIAPAHVFVLHSSPVFLYSLWQANMSLFLWRLHFSTLMTLFVLSTVVLPLFVHLFVWLSSSWCLLWSSFFFSSSVVNITCPYLL